MVSAFARRLVAGVMEQTPPPESPSGALRALAGRQVGQSRKL